MTAATAGIASIDVASSVVEVYDVLVDIREAVEGEVLA